MSVWRIYSGYFCAGIVTRHKVVKEAAPILHYMLGWSLDRVKSYAKRKRWGIELVTLDTTEPDEHQS